MGVGYAVLSFGGVFGIGISWAKELHAYYNVRLHWDDLLPDDPDRRTTAGSPRY
jgi:hypothetical protein